jgi:dihydrodipicolinate synthase/N-acetylneuraminate lyase
MLKHEAWPGLEKISTLRRAEENGARRVSILCGNGAQFLLEEMIRGADGAMTGFAYPEMMADVVRLMTEGEEDARPRPLRRLHAAHPLRGAAGSRPRHPQAHARAPGRHRARHRAQTLAAALRGRHRRARHPHRPAGGAARHAA